MTEQYQYVASTSSPWSKFAVPFGCCVTSSENDGALVEMKNNLLDALYNWQGVRNQSGSSNNAKEKGHTKIIPAEESPAHTHWIWARMYNLRRIVEQRLGHW